MKKNLPIGAFKLVDADETCKASCFKEGDSKQLKMQINSGKPITNHWYWGTLVIDMAGMSLSGSRFPILEDHDTDKKIAHTGKPIVTDNFALQVDPDNTTFVSTKESETFQKLSAENFPYQASVRGTPTEIQRLAEKEVAQVNGFELKGPAYIWRKWIFKEGSVTVFGADSKTQSSAFSEQERAEVDIDLIGDSPEEWFKEKEEEVKLKRSIRKEKGMEIKDLKLAELKEGNPTLFKEIQDEASKAATKALKEEFTKKEKGFTQENEKLNTEVTKMSTIVVELQKKDVIRDENVVKLSAESIWKLALTESNIPEHMHSKVTPCVTRGTFTKEGIFDEEKFKEAVEAEIADWEAKGMGESKVQGFSTTGRTPTDTLDDGDMEGFSEEETQGTVDKMLKSAGHVTTK